MPASKPAVDIDGAGQVSATTHPAILYALVALAGFCLAFGITHLVTNWKFISTLFYETNLARYEVMAGERGPTTYLVFHKNLGDLQNLADANEDILGVEQSDFSSVAKMAFRSAQSPLIETVRQHPSVMNMVNRNVPMLCH